MRSVHNRKYVTCKSQSHPAKIDAIISNIVHNFGATIQAIPRKHHCTFAYYVESGNTSVKTCRAVYICTSILMSVSYAPFDAQCTKRQTQTLLSMGLRNHCSGNAGHPFHCLTVKDVRILLISLTVALISCHICNCHVRSSIKLQLIFFRSMESNLALQVKFGLNAKN